MTICYIYGLRSRDESAHFYVGSTKIDPAERLKAHLWEVEHGCHSNRHFSNKVKKLGPQNVIIDILEETNESDRWQKELDWIDTLKKQGLRLVNKIHNGVDFEIEAMEEDYYLTPLKFKIACAITERPSGTAKNPNNQKLLGLIHDELKNVISEIKTRFPDEFTALMT